MEEPKRKRGRPLKDGAKRKDLHLRMTEDVFDDIERFSKEDDISKNDYILRCIKVYNTLKKSDIPLDEDEDRSKTSTESYAHDEDDYEIYDDFYEEDYYNMDEE